MDSSPGFGSTAYCYYVALLTLAFAMSSSIWTSTTVNGNSLAHSSIGTISLHKVELYRFVRKQFQVLFHWASRPSFRLSLTVLVHYRLQVIFSLGGWFPQIPTKYLRRGTREFPRCLYCFAYTTLMFYGQLFHTVLLLHKLPHWAPTTPRCFRRNDEVWTIAISLSATEAISFDFSSSPYLDVSVRVVPFCIL